MNNSILICPKCKKELKKRDNSFVCCNHHSFDIAKEGYVNLILSNKKKSKRPGDDKLMVNARSLFLAGDFYSQLKNEIIKSIATYCDCMSSMIDCGCGTGYYLEGYQSFRNRIGIDISKDAIKLAAKEAIKKEENILYIVASIFDLPIKDRSIDCILNVFAPKPNAEFLRVLKPNGIIIEVIPGEEHLHELKQLLYNDVHLNRTDVKPFDALCIIQRNITYKKILNNSQLLQLFHMTPFVYKTKQEDVQKLGSIDSCEITFDFILKVWKVV